MTTISLIAAVAENGIIGRDGDMPWRLRADLQRFKAITLGHPIIMGRKTFKSIGKALPGRPNIVVTRDRDWQAPGAIVADSVEQAIALAEQLTKPDEPEIHVIGGGEIYRQTMDQADEMRLTTVHAEPEGDTKFPDFDVSLWRLVEEEHVENDHNNSHATTYRHYRRSRNS